MTISVWQRCISCQVFAQKRASFTLAQDYSYLTLPKQGAKASAYIPCARVFASEPHALHLRACQLDPPRDGPHLPYQTNDAVVTQARCRLAQPATRPDQDIVG